MCARLIKTWRITPSTFIFIDLKVENHKKEQQTEASSPHIPSLHITAQRAISCRASSADDKTAHTMQLMITDHRKHSFCLFTVCPNADQVPGQAASLSLVSPFTLKDTNTQYHF